MALYKELVYLVSDEIKAMSDDSTVTVDHIKFLLEKYRAFLLFQKYKDIKKEIPQSTYQDVCLDLEIVNTIDNEPCVGGTYLRSKEVIPKLMSIGNPQVYPYKDYYQGYITYIPRERMRFVGHNKFLRNIIYCSLSSDGYLYFTSNNPQLLYLQKVSFSGIFENPEKAFNLNCGSTDNNTCDIMDTEFPIEEAMIPILIEHVVRELLGVNYRPEDPYNNASNDLTKVRTTN